MLKPTLDEIQEQQEYLEANDIKYSCRIHPITKLRMPDIMDTDRGSMIDATCTILYATIPMTINYFLNYASGLISIYFIGLNFESQPFCYICLGTVITNLLIFYIIEYTGTGFAIVCSYFGDAEKEEVGFLYQKTLGITFLICVIMTPAIYLSDKCLYLLGFDHQLVQNACSYAWSLVPAFYLYSFIDTNINYLQSQNVIFPPIVIHFLSTLIHLGILVYYDIKDQLGLQAVAWSKNITDGLCALTLYLFIILKQPTKASWVEWSIKATNNINRFVQQVIHHQAYTYTELIAFHILCIVIGRLPIQAISAHFSYALIYIVTSFGYMSLTQCVSHSIAKSIEQNEAELCKKKISMGVLLSLLLSSVLIINIVHYRLTFVHIFITDTAVAAQVQAILYLFCAVMLVSGMNSIMLGIVKTLQLQLIWNYSFIFCYFMGICLGAILCYVYDYGLWGIWVGWLLCLLVELYLNLKRVLCLNFQQAFLIIRDRYNVVKEDIRASKYEMTVEVEVESQKELNKEK